MGTISGEYANPIMSVPLSFDMLKAAISASRNVLSQLTRDVQTLQRVVEATPYPQTPTSVEMHPKWSDAIASAQEKQDELQRIVTSMTFWLEYVNSEDAEFSAAVACHKHEMSRESVRQTGRDGH